MSEQSTDYALDPCAQLTQAVLAYQRIVTGEAARSIGSRERNVSFESITLEQARTNLVKLVASPLFHSCQNYQLAVALTGVSQNRSPATRGNNNRGNPCGCPPPNKRGTC